MAGPDLNLAALQAPQALALAERMIQRFGDAASTHHALNLAERMIQRFGDAASTHHALAAEPARRLLRLLKPLRWFRLPFVRWAAPRVLREDQLACEAMRSAALLITPDPLHGAAKRRIGRFNQAHAKALRPDDPA